MSSSTFVTMISILIIFVKHLGIHNNKKHIYNIFNDISMVFNNLKNIPLKDLNWDE